MSQHLFSEKKIQASAGIIMPILGAEGAEDTEATVMAKEEARDMATLTPAAAGGEVGCRTRCTAEDEAATVTVTVPLIIEAWSRTMLRRCPPPRTCCWI